MHLANKYALTLLLLAACGRSELEGPELTVRLLNAAGEYPAANELTAPSGAALRASNVVIDVPQKYTTHRGFAMSAPSGRVLDTFTLYRGDVIAHSTDGTLLRLHNGTWSEYSGSYLAPDGDLMSFQEASGSLFFTTSEGVCRLDGPTATPVPSGLAQSLPGTVALAGTGSALGDGLATAYRSNWAVNVDDGGTGRLVEGAPSPRLVIGNSSGGTQDVSLTFPIPDGLAEGSYLRVFRADAVPITILPIDEMRQVYEREPSTDEVANRVFAFTDSTPDSVKGAGSYWSANTGDGLAQSNYQSPLAHSLALYSDSVFGANVDGVQRLSINILGVEAPSGLVVGQFVELIRGGTREVYVANSAEDFSNPVAYLFKLFTDGTPAQNVARTTESLARAINTRLSGLARGFAVNDTGDAPGRLLIEARDLSQVPIEFETAFGSAQAFAPAPRARAVSTTIARTSGVVTVTTATAHGYYAGEAVMMYSSPGGSLFPLGSKVITSTPAATSFTYAEAGADGSAGVGFLFISETEAVTTSPGTALNAYAWTKRYEPDHWPLANVNTVGSSRDRLWWALPLDRWLFLGSDAGLFRVNGNADDGFQSPEEGAPWDSTVKFLGKRNVAVLDGRAYAMSRQGIVSWSEGSKPTAVDAPIQKEIRDSVSAFPDSVAALGFMYADATHHRLYVFMPESAEAESATVAHVLNFPTGGAPAWTRLTSEFPGLEQGALAGTAPPEAGGVMYVLPASGGEVEREGTILSERLTGSDTDYRGPENQGLPAEVVYLPAYAGEPERWKQWTWTRIFTEAPCTRIAFGMATEAVPAWEYQILPDVDPITAPVPVEEPVRSLAWKTRISANPDGTSKARAKALTMSIQHAVANEPLNLLGIEVKARAYGSGQ